MRTQRIVTGATRLVRPLTKKQQVINFLKTKGPRGAYFSEIQRFIVELNGFNYDDKHVINQWEVNAGKAPRYLRKHRGYYCDWLYGGGYPIYRDGFLATCCERTKDGNRVRYSLKKELA